jgi:transposase
MQIFHLHKSIYKLSRVVSPEEKLDPYLLEIKDKMMKWQKLKAHNVPERDIAQITNISRATFYRYQKQIKTYGLKGLERRSKRPKTFRSSKIALEEINLILKLRRENRTYGKAKITVLIKRDHGIILSESSVGRVLAKLISLGKITRSISSHQVKRKRNFKAHAKAWQYGMKAQNPGELIQIDHMSVTKHNIHMKEFRAWDPITKVIIAEVTSNATSAAAAKFLRKVIADMPFPVKSVQVDGGSEFMKDFETECQKLNIPLFVLPPSRPQWNGGVERGNRIFREEFYGRNDLKAESIGEFKYELQKAVHKYNSYRPHFSLNGLTPFQYAAQILAA